MKPVDFEGSNCVFAENQEEYLSLPAYKHGDECGTVTACWQLSIRERLKVLFTGKMYLSLLTFNKPLTPHLLDTDSPVSGEEAAEASKATAR